MRPIVKAVGLICILAHYYLIVKMINVIRVSCRRSRSQAEHRCCSSPDGDRSIFS